MCVFVDIFLCLNDATINIFSLVTIVVVVAGNVYKGDFVQGVMSGVGELKYGTGHRYVGHWQRNKKNGFGVFTFDKSHRYEGHWLGV